MIHPRSKARLGGALPALALVAAVLFLVTAGSPGVAPVAPAPEAASPSYASLQALLQDGSGKGEDHGTFEMFQFADPDPSGWIWATEDTRDGDGTVYRAFHDSYVHPSAEDDVVKERIEFVSSDEPASIDDWLDYIVANNASVLSRSELTVHKCVVSDATP